MPSCSATLRSRSKAGGWAIASADNIPGPGSCPNGVPSTSQNGRSMKRIDDQQRGQSPPCRPVRQWQWAQLGGKTMSRRKAAMPIGTATLTDTAFCTI
ncbi:hypothetical protein D3C72_2100720 [compost metagenome]